MAAPVQHERFPLYGVLARNIRYYRELEGISQIDLAKEAKMARSTLVALEMGKRNISLLTLFRIAEVLKKRPTALLTNTGI